MNKRLWVRFTTDNFEPCAGDRCVPEVEGIHISVIWGYSSFNFAISPNKQGLVVLNMQFSLVFMYAIWSTGKMRRYIQSKKNWDFTAFF